MAANGGATGRMLSARPAIHAADNPAMRLGLRPNLGATNWD